MSFVAVIEMTSYILQQLVYIVKLSYEYGRSIKKYVIFTVNPSECTVVSGCSQENIVLVLTSVIEESKISFSWRS